MNLYITNNQSFCKLDFQKMKKTLFSLMVLLFTSSFAFSTTHYVNSGNFEQVFNFYNRLVATSFL